MHRSNFGVHNVVNVRSRYVNEYALHGVSEVPSSSSVNYKFLFIYFSASFLIDVYNISLELCGARRHAARQPSVEATRHENNESIRWLIRWDTMFISKCANEETENEWQNVIIACFISFFIDHFSAQFWVFVRRLFRSSSIWDTGSEKSELIGKGCACNSHQCVIESFSRAHGANHVRSPMPAGIVGTTSSAGNGKLLLFGLIYHVFFVNQNCVHIRGRFVGFMRREKKINTQVCSIFIVLRWIVARCSSACVCSFLRSLNLIYCNFRHRTIS